MDEDVPCTSCGNARGGIAVTTAQDARGGDSDSESDGPRRGERRDHQGAAPPPGWLRVFDTSAEGALAAAAAAFPGEAAWAVAHVPGGAEVHAHAPDAAGRAACVGRTRMLERACAAAGATPYRGELADLLSRCRTCMWHVLT